MIPNLPSKPVTMTPKDMLIQKPFQLYKRRYWMLIVFSCFSIWQGIMYPQYTSTATATACYYRVSPNAVSWTISLSNLLYVLVVFPATSMMERIGLKWTITLGVVFNLVSSAVQFATISRGNFSYVLVSNIFSSLSSVAILGSPPVLASRWFAEAEQTRACAVGFAGYQLGMSTGSLFPLILSNDCTKPELIERGKLDISVFLTTGNVVFLILVLFSFQGRPPSPPSHQQSVLVSQSYTPKLILTMLRNKDFVVILAVFGMLNGVFSALLANFNFLLLRFFPNSEVHVGWMGFIFTSGGIAEGFATGYIIDRTHKYKHLSMIICILCFIFYLVFICFLYIDAIWVQYITILILGLVSSGIYPLGFEYSLEVTYPDSEVLCSNIFITVSLTFSVVFTQLSTYVLHQWNEECFCLLLSFPIVLACFLTCLSTTDYKRLNSIKEEVDSCSAPPLGS